MSKQLQQNQSDIYQRLTVYDERIVNLTSQVSFLGRYGSSYYATPRGGSLSTAPAARRCARVCTKLKTVVLSLFAQVTNLDTRLSAIEKKINENTELSNPDATKDPSVKVLWSEVAKLGSNYQALNDSVKSLKDTTSSLQSYHTKLKANITSINVR